MTQSFKIETVDDVLEFLTNRYIGIKCAVQFTPENSLSRMQVEQMVTLYDQLIADIITMRPLDPQ